MNSPLTVKNFEVVVKDEQAVYMKKSFLHVNVLKGNSIVKVF